MSDLTDADKSSFIDKMITALETNKDALLATGWDSSQRAINLTNGVKAVTAAGGVITQLEVALSQAYENRRNLLEANYTLASATVGGIESALTKKHALVREIRQTRGSMHRGDSGGEDPAA